MFSLEDDHNLVEGDYNFIVQVTFQKGIYTPLIELAVFWEL